MGFEKAGKFRLSKSGRSVTVEYTDTYSLFKSRMFLNLEDVRKVLSGDVVEADVFVIEPEENNESCEVHRS